MDISTGLPYLLIRFRMVDKARNQEDNELEIFIPQLLSCQTEFKWAVAFALLKAAVPVLLFLQLHVYLGSSKSILSVFRSGAKPPSPYLEYPRMLYHSLLFSFHWFENSVEYSLL